MKRIRIILKREGDQEILSIRTPLFVGIVADRFVIEDRRGPTKPAKSKSKPAAPK